MSTVRLRHLAESQGLQGWHENVKIGTVNAPDFVFSRHSRFVEARPVPRKQSAPSSCLPQKRSLQVLQVSRKLHLVVPNELASLTKVQSCFYWQLQGGMYQALASDIVTCSMWVACAGSRCTSNTTTNDGEDSISHQVDALVFPPTTSLA